MSKIKVNKEICKVYGKSIVNGLAHGFSSTFVTAAGVIATIVTPGWRNKLAIGTATLCNAYYSVRGAVAVTEDLCMESVGLSPWPIEFEDDPEKCLE